MMVRMLSNNQARAAGSKSRNHVALVPNFSQHDAASAESSKRSRTMAFESVWGFDPEKPAAYENSCEQLESSYGLIEQHAARSPSDDGAQLYELKRMFRL